MFGLNDHQQQSNDDPAMLDNVKQLASQPASQVAPQSPPLVATDAETAHAEPAQGFSNVPDPIAPAAAPSLPPATATPLVVDNSNDLSDDKPSSYEETPIAPTDMTASSDKDTNSNESEPSTALADENISNGSSATEPPAVSAPSTPVDNNHLAGLKQQALGHLEPLTNHIDGTPEETFKTTMMMIQANDNHTLLEKALEAAKKIEDDKVRAKALLDIINEINYFASLQQES